MVLCIFPFSKRHLLFSPLDFVNQNTITLCGSLRPVDFGRFSDFWRIFKFLEDFERFLEEFQIFGGFSDFWRIFRVLEDFQIFGEFSEFLKISRFLEDFQIFWKIFRFLKDFQIFKRFSDF